MKVRLIATGTRPLLIHNVRLASPFEREVAEHGQRLAAEAAPVAPVEGRTEEQDPNVLVDELREEYAQVELDQDRNPTETGFIAWLAVRATPAAVAHGIARRRLGMGVPVAEHTRVTDVQAALVTLRAYLEDLQDGFLQSEASAIFEALGKVEQHIRGEQK